jgi:hypothetical protein
MRATPTRCSTVAVQPIPPEIGESFDQAITAIDALADIETPPDRDGAEGGSNGLRGGDGGN